MSIKTTTGAPNHKLQVGPDGNVRPMTLDGGRWPAGPERPDLGDGEEVHVWFAPLDQPTDRLDALRAVLSADERQRATRFRFERDRERFVAAHGALRLVLERYMDAPARDLRFEVAATGKPSLAGVGVRFNLSHSGDVGLVAVACQRDVGCDVERVSERPRIEQLAQRFFSQSERTALAALPEAERRRAFFECWTRKEAFIKARGEGLSRPLDSFDVTVNGSPRVLATRPDPDDAARWRLIALDPAPGYAAALCVAGGEPIALRCWSAPTSARDH